MIRGSVCRNFRSFQPTSAIGHVPEQRVQVLDHEQKPLVSAIREVQEYAEAPIRQELVVPGGAKLFDGALQIGTVFATRGLSGQVR